MHRVRAARAARLDRAPEDVVNSLPSLVWTGKAWEKEVTSPQEARNDAPADEDASTSNGGKTTEEHPWFEQQVECAICLSEFVKGDKVRVLPCHHIFHMVEVDEWLIHRKKLVRRLHFFARLSLTPLLAVSGL